VLGLDCVFFIDDYRAKVALRAELGLHAGHKLGEHGAGRRLQLSLQARRCCCLLLLLQRGVQQSEQQQLSLRHTGRPNDAATVFSILLSSPGTKQLSGHFKSVRVAIHFTSRWLKDAVQQQWSA